MALVPTGNGAQMTHDHKLQVQVGGRAAATTWPMESGQALDVFFDGKDGAYQPGYYRGIVDVAGAPSKTGIQKLDIDFPDDRTSAAIDLKRSQLYAPGTEPAKPGEADGEVAREVTASELPGVELSATPYGLTAPQQKVIKDLYYGDFHYAGRERTWALLKERARKDGKLEEKVVKRKDGEVTVSTPFGIRYRQLQQYAIFGGDGAPTTPQATDQGQDHSIVCAPGGSDPTHDDGHDVARHHREFLDSHWPIYSPLTSCAATPPNSLRRAMALSGRLHSPPKEPNA